MTLLCLTVGLMQISRVQYFFMNTASESRMSGPSLRYRSNTTVCVQISIVCCVLVSQKRIQATVTLLCSVALSEKQLASAAGFRLTCRFHNRIFQQGLMEFLKSAWMFSVRNFRRPNQKWAIWTRTICDFSFQNC